MWDFNSFRRGKGLHSAFSFFFTFLMKNSVLPQDIQLFVGQVSSMDLCKLQGLVQCPKDQATGYFVNNWPFNVLWRSDTNFI